MTYLLLTISWLLFFAVHSFMASHRFKAQISGCCPMITKHFRLLYNLFASVTVMIPLAIYWFHPGPILWQWQGISWYLMNLIALLAIAGFLLSSKHYDMAAFLGFRHHHHGALTTADEPFKISPFHRYVRHPWYFFGLLLIWTRDMPLSWFITCALTTLYFMLGSRWEEDKLIVDYGERYRQYRQRVPALIPRPWKFLTADEAKALSEE